MSEPRYVYVVEQGCYSSRGVIGVYATAEAAMEDLPITEMMLKRYPKARWHQWDQAEPNQRWSNGCDWDDAMDIARYEVHG